MITKSTLVKRIAIVSLFCFFTLSLFSTFAFAGLFGGGDKIKTGDHAPTFKAKDLDGNEIDFSDYLKKKVIILDYWSIYCTSCVEEIPALVEIYKKYNNDGLIVFGIDLDSFGTKRVVRFIEGLDFKIPYPTIIDKKREIAKIYGVSIIPVTVVIDLDGIIRMYKIGYKHGDEKDIEKLVKKLLPKK